MVAKQGTGALRLSFFQDAISFSNLEVTVNGIDIDLVEINDAQ